MKDTLTDGADRKSTQFDHFESKSDGDDILLHHSEELPALLACLTVSSRPQFEV